MNAWEPPNLFVEVEEAVAPFVVTRPKGGGAASPLVFASPHSGRLYPDALMAVSRLDAFAIRQSEDAYVDGLIERAPLHGASVITAQLARVYMDVNREPWDLDPAMFEDELPAYARSRSARVAAGLGAIARVVREGEEIYTRKLCFAEARARVEAVHTPYHDALAMLMREAREAWGVAVLIDWHSMPAAAAQGGEIVLGDRYGGACAPAFSAMVERTLKAMGYAVARNSPYAGGFTTEHYGRPAQRVHALQIEVSRALYMDEASMSVTAGFERLRADLERLFEVIASVNWARL
jgi:N-formylglutamate amidohydrolase